MNETIKRHSATTAPRVGAESRDGTVLLVLLGLGGAAFLASKLFEWDVQSHRRKLQQRASVVRSGRRL